jgi:hypothetical protein
MAGPMAKYEQSGGQRPAPKDARAEEAARRVRMQVAG